MHTFNSLQFELKRSRASEVGGRIGSHTVVNTWVSWKGASIDSFRRHSLSLEKERRRVELEPGLQPISMGPVESVVFSHAGIRYSAPVRLDENWRSGAAVDDESAIDYGPAQSVFGCNEFFCVDLRPRSRTVQQTCLKSLVLSK